MSKRPKYRKEDFPEPGSVIVAPLADGRLCAGLVLRCEFYEGATGVLISVSTWIGEQPPPLDLPELHETLVLTHHQWQRHPERFWTWDLMPASFSNLGKAELSDSERETTCYVSSSWNSMPLQVLTQWRWDHERDALLREEAQQAAELAETRRRQAERRAALMRSLTLESLVDHTWFPAWDAQLDTLPVDQCRTLLRDLVRELRAAPKLTVGAVKKSLKRSVEAFNQLDTDRQFIHTLEREAISEAYEQILCAAKFPQLVDQVERWRTW